MKNVKLLSLLITVIICLSGNTYAERGTEGGGGGNDISANFVEYARYAIQAMKSLPTLRNGNNDSFYNVNHAQEIENAIPKVEIFSVPKKALCKIETGLNGEVFDLCHDAWFDDVNMKILVNLESWPKKNCIKKMALVLHEYGRVAGLETANYSFSSHVHGSLRFKNWCAYIGGIERDRENNQRRGVGNGL